ncbi:hypothetical protein [Paraconexibacter sp.]|uniref:hypothetical protein n=1 Tax=Paraconexibacter sp. TaxID=2949640 RepID=UPI003567EEE9
MRRAPGVLTLLLIGLVLPAPASAASKSGVFAGSLGVKVPKGGHATIRAIQAGSGTVVTARDVRRTGTFRLTLPPGPYVVRGVVVPRSGRVVTRSIAVSLKPGQRRTRTKLTARKRRRAKAGRRAGAAYTTERGNVRLGTVAVGIHPFSGPSDGEFGPLSGGLDDLLITDVLNLAASRCKNRVAIREIARIADVLREFELGNSPYADKSTFPKRNLIIVDVGVRGRLTELPDGGARVSVTLTDERSGATLDTVEQTLDPSDVFAGTEQLAGKLTDKLCKLSETFEVTLDLKGDGNFATHRAAGGMRAVLRARRTGDQWTASGPLQWQDVTFTSKTECPYIDVVTPVITWSVTITDSGEGLTLRWDRSGNDAATASIDCPPDGPDHDPPPIPGQPGPSLLNTGNETFTLPYTGGTLPFTGGFTDGGDGFTNVGTLRVRPVGITAPG